jgi:hypothetical protein
VANWISFNQTEYVLDVGEEQIVSYRIDVPPTTTFGRQHAVIFAAGSGVDTSGNNSVRTVSRVGSVLYTTIEPGNAKMNEGNTKLIIYLAAGALALVTTFVIMFWGRRRKKKVN